MTLEGNRPLLVEIEALTTYTKFGYPKRSSRGVNTGKLDLVIAVLSKYTETKLESYDIFANVGRGLQINEPAIDLALAAAIMSSKLGVSLGKSVYLGELSLTGGVRAIPSLEKRIEECIKLGFSEIYIPAGSKTLKKKQIAVTEISHIRELQKYIKRPSGE